MQISRTYNGKPLDDAAFKRLDIGENPEVRAIFSAVVARLERLERNGKKPL